MIVCRHGCINHYMLLLFLRQFSLRQNNKKACNKAQVSSFEFNLKKWRVVSNIAILYAFLLLLNEYCGKSTHFFNLFLSRCGLWCSECYYIFFLFYLFGARICIAICASLVTFFNVESLGNLFRGQFHRGYGLDGCPRVKWKNASCIFVVSFYGPCYQWFSPFLTTSLKVCW